MSEHISLFTRLRRFARAKRGLAALEFALIAPMMVFLLLGTVELLDALNTNRRAENTAVSIADVVSRDTEISNSELSSMWSAEDLLLYPNSSSAMDARITSILVNSATDARVVWSEVKNGYTQQAVNAQVTLPSDMMVPGSSLIRTETIYHYAPPLGVLFGGSVSFTHTAYRRSRLVDPIPRVP